MDEEIKQEKSGVNILDWSQFLPEGYIEGDINQSGKLTVLFQLLSELKSSQDRIVIVSNYTTTLRLLEIFCLAKGFPTVRYKGRALAFRDLESMLEINDLTFADWTVALRFKSEEKW